MKQLKNLGLVLLAGFVLAYMYMPTVSYGLQAFLPC